MSPGRGVLVGSHTSQSSVDTSPQATEPASPRPALAPDVRGGLQSADDTLAMQGAHGNGAAVDLALGAPVSDSETAELTAIVSTARTTIAQQLGADLLYVWRDHERERESPYRILTAMHARLSSLEESVGQVVAKVESGTPALRETEVMTHQWGLSEARSYIGHLRSSVGAGPRSRDFGGYKALARLIAGPVDAACRLLEGDPLLRAMGIEEPVEAAVGAVGAGASAVAETAEGPLRRATEAVQSGPEMKTRFTEKFLLATAMAPGFIVQFWLVLKFDVATGGGSPGNIRLQQSPDGSVSAVAGTDPFEEIRGLERLGMSGGLKLSDRGDLQLRVDGGGLGVRVNEQLTKAELVAKAGPTLSAGPMSVSADIKVELVSDQGTAGGAMVLSPAAVAAIDQAQLAVMAMAGTFVVVAAGGVVLASGAEALALIQAGTLPAECSVLFEAVAIGSLGAAGAP